MALDGLRIGEELNRMERILFAILLSLPSLLFDLCEKSRIPRHSAWISISTASPCVPCVPCVPCTLRLDDRRSLTSAVNYITANDVKQESSARSTIGMCEIIPGISFQWSLRTDPIGCTALTNYATISPLRLDDLSSRLGFVIDQRARLSSCSSFTNVQLQAYNGA